MSRGGWNRGCSRAQLSLLGDGTPGFEGHSPHTVWTHQQSESTPHQGCSAEKQVQVLGAPTLAPLPDSDAVSPQAMLRTTSGLA